MRRLGSNLLTKVVVHVARCVYAILWLLVFVGCTGDRAFAFTPKEAPVSGEEILFFPYPASVSANGQFWSITVQGRIFKPANESRGRRLMIETIARRAGLDDHEKKSALLPERVSYFLSDSEKNKIALVKIGNQIFSLPASNQAGYFTIQIPLAKDVASKLAKDRVISFESLPTAVNSRRFAGEVTLVPEEGVSGRAPHIDPALYDAPGQSPSAHQGPPAVFGKLR